MLTTEALKEYRKIIEYSRWLGMIPYAWNNKQGRVEFRGSRRCRLFWNMQFGLYCLYESFLMFRWLWALLDREKSGPERAVNLQYVTWGSMFLVSQHFCTWRNYGQHHTMINQFLQHFQHFQNNHKHLIAQNEGKSKKKPDCARFMRNFVIFGTVNTILNFISIFRKPQSPHFITSILPNPKSLKAPKILPFALAHAFIGSAQWFTCYFYNFTIICYLFGMQQILPLLKHELGGQRTFQSSATHPYVFQREFRSLQLLQSHFNQLFKTYLAHLQLLLIITITLGYFAGFQLEGGRAFQTAFLASMFLLIFVTMWNYLAEVNVRSNSILRSWESARGLPWMRRFLRTCRPLSTHIGDFVYADKALVLATVSVIIDTTATLLLNFRYS